MLGKYSEAERVNAKCEFVCELVRQISKYSCTPKCSTEDGASDLYCDYHDCARAYGNLFENALDWRLVQTMHML